MEHLPSRLRPPTTVQGSSCCGVELTGIFGLAPSWIRGSPARIRTASGMGRWRPALQQWWLVPGQRKQRSQWASFLAVSDVTEILTSNSVIFRLRRTQLSQPDGEVSGGMFFMCSCWGNRERNYGQNRGLAMNSKVDYIRWLGGKGTVQALRHEGPEIRAHCDGNCLRRNGTQQRNLQGEGTFQHGPKSWSYCIDQALSVG